MATYLPLPSKQHSKMNWIIIHLKRKNRGPKGRGSKMFFIKDYSFPKSLKQRRKRHLTIFGHSLLFLKKANFRNEYNLLFSSLYNFNKRSFVPWKLTSSSQYQSSSQGGQKNPTSAGQFEEIIDITTKFELWPNMRLNLENEGQKTRLQGAPLFSNGQ